MQLSGKQKKDLYNALIDAFPRLSDLDDLLFPLDDSICAGVGGSNPEAILTSLIIGAMGHDAIPDVILAARTKRPKNVRVMRLAEQWNLAPTLMTEQGCPLLDEPGFESIVAKNGGWLDFEEFFETGRQRGLAVCRVESPPGNFLGTGFLVSPDLVMTNHHVLQGAVEEKRPGEQVALRFDYRGTQPGETAYRLRSRDWLIDWSAKDRLDYVLVRTEGTPGEDPVPGKAGAVKRGWLEPVRWDFQSQREGLLVIEHPQGEPMKVSLGAVTGVNPATSEVLHTVSTQPGSSGSPCFNWKWELVALHHVGGAAAQDNRAVMFSAILRQIRGLSPTSEPLAARAPMSMVSAEAAGAVTGSEPVERSPDVLANAPAAPPEAILSLCLTSDDEINARTTASEEQATGRSLGSDDIMLTARAVRQLMRDGGMNRYLLEQVGDDLYQLLFPGHVGHMFERHAAAVIDAHRKDRDAHDLLRVVFDLQPHSAALNGRNGRWLLEQVYYAAADKWLTTSPEFTFSRRSQASGRVPEPLSETLNVLLVVSSPAKSKRSGRTPVDTATAIPNSAPVGSYEDKHRLQVRALGSRMREHILLGALEKCPPASWWQLSQLANGGWRPQVLHFIGNGDTREGVSLIFETNEGSEDPIRAKDLYELVDAWGVPVVVLQAPENAPPETDDALMEVAEHLAQRGLPAVVATQFAPPLATAQVFSDGFYRALISGDDIEKAATYGRWRVQQISRSMDPTFASFALYSCQPAIKLVAPRTALPRS